jgi:hypothetical protein
LALVRSNGFAAVAKRFLREPFWKAARPGSLRPCVAVTVQRNARDANQPQATNERLCAIGFLPLNDLREQVPCRGTALKHLRYSVTETNHRLTFSFHPGVGDGLVCPVNVLATQ